MKTILGGRGSLVSRIGTTSILVAFICFGIGCDRCRTTDLDPKRYYAEDRDKAWRNDLRYIVDCFNNYHTNPYLEISEQDFRDAVSALDAAIPTLTDNEIKLELSRLVAMVGDAHTKLYLVFPSIDLLPDWFDGEILRSYPIRVHWFSDGLFVIGSTTGHADTLGARVVQIGTSTPDEIMRLIRPLIAHSVEEWVVKESADYLVSPEVLHALGLIDNMSSAPYKFENSEGATFEVNLSPFDRSLVSAGDIDSYNPGSMLSPPIYDQNPLWESALGPLGADSYPRSLKDPFSYYWYEFIEEENAVYFQYNIVENDPDGRSFRPFFDGMIDFIDDNKVDKLIIDMRFNNGGNYTIPEPKWEKLGRHRLNEEGKIHVLIGRNTFSAATVSVHLIKQHTNAVFFGEGVGDTPEMYYTLVRPTLPNSKVLFTYAQCHRIFPDLTEQLVPDVEVPMSSADYLSGFDPVLEAALAY